MSIALVGTNGLSAILVGAFSANWAHVLTSMWWNVTFAFICANCFCTVFVCTLTANFTLVLTTVWCCVTRTLFCASTFRAGCIQTFVASGANALASVSRCMTLALVYTNGLCTSLICTLTTLFALVLTFVWFGLHATGKHNHCDAQHN